MSAFSLIVILPITYFVWLCIHEALHVWLAMKFGGEIKSIKLYPHKFKGDWRFAGVYYYLSEVSDSKRGWISFAPRIAALVGAIICFLMTELDAGPYVTTILFGGIVDMFVASVATSDNSDLKKWSRAWGHNPLFWRAIGVSASLMLGIPCLVYLFQVL